MGPAEVQGLELVFGLSGKALVNIESFSAVTFVAALVVRAVPSRSRLPGGASSVRESLGFFIAAACLVLLLHRGMLHNGFLFDDYTHLRDAGQATFQSLMAQFGQVPGQHLFYRPVPAMGYWMDLHWAGLDPFRWHLWSLVAHAVDSLLVFTLLRLMNFRLAAATAGGLFFAGFAGSVEAVAWVDARYELTCAFFVLLALILMLVYARKPHWAWLAAALFTCALACGTKESGFAIPLLGAALSISLESPERKNMIKASLGTLALCLGLFAYRWWALGGIGGYTASGSPTFLRLNPLHALNGLLFRAWGFLWFPINWSAGLTWLEVSALILYVGALVMAVCVTRVRRELVLCAIAFVLAALLPVYQMTLIGSDLAGSREFYVATVGVAILVAALYSVPRVIAILLFHAAILHHNLKFWSATSQIASAVCREAASQKETPMMKLPAKRDGVPFLANGFPECVNFFRLAMPATTGDVTQHKAPLPGHDLPSARHP